MRLELEENEQSILDGQIRKQGNSDVNDIDKMKIRKAIIEKTTERVAFVMRHNGYAVNKVRSGRKNREGKAKKMFMLHVLEEPGVGSHGDWKKSEL